MPMSPCNPPHASALKICKFTSCPFYEVKKMSELIDLVLALAVLVRAITQFLSKLRR